MRFSELLGGAFVLVLIGCPSQKDEATRIGVDQALRSSGLAEALQNTFEAARPERLQIVYADTDVLKLKAAKGEIDHAIVLSEDTRREFESEGIAQRSKVFAHEEFLFIGPPAEKDPMGRRKYTTASNFLRNVARSHYRYVKGEPGSIELARHVYLWKQTKEQAPGAFFEGKDSGLNHARRIIEGQSLGLVRRSALMQGAQENVRPHLIYKDGDPDLVLRIAVLEIHPAKTGRGKKPSFYNFAAGPQTANVIKTFGETKFGLPLFGVGDVPPGEPAVIPGLEKLGLKKRPSAATGAIPDDLKGLPSSHHTGD